LKSSGTPRAVGDLLPDAMPQLAERLAEVRVHQAWETVVGLDAARRTRPGSLVEGCLTVIVDNSPWLHELSLRQSELLAMIRLRCPSVKALRLTVGALSPDAREGGTVTAPAMPLSERDQRAIDEATALLPDAALAAAARRLLTRVRRAEGRSELPS
jgi:hypothetical protein